MTSRILILAVLATAPACAARGTMPVSDAKVTAPSSTAQLILKNVP